MYSSKTMWFCLLCTSLTATIVFAAMEEPHKFGAALAGNCKQPCSDTWITSVEECDDVAGIPPEHRTANGCHDSRCTINNIRYIVCSSPETEGNNCVWHRDPNDWVRWVTVREMPCTDLGAYTWDPGPCAGNQQFGPVDTPCKSNGCSGPIYDNQDYEDDHNDSNPAVPLKRTRCGP